MRFTDELTSQIVAAASAAPSIHNTQPWQFEQVGDELRLHGAHGQALWVSDPAARGLYISCGAALFNARLAARIVGLDTTVLRLPHPDYPFDVLAVMRPREAQPPGAAISPLYQSIWKRHTDRRPYSSRKIPHVLAVALQKAARAEAGHLRFLDRKETSIVLKLGDQAGLELAADPAHQGELRQHMGDTSADAMPGSAMPLPPQHAPSPVRDDDFLSAAPWVSGVRAAYERHPQLGVLTTERDEPQDWLRAGEALQHVLLVATLNGLSASFLYQEIERDDMRDEGERSWPWPEHPQMILRLGYGLGALPTPRRSSADIMQSGESMRLPAGP